MNPNSEKLPAEPMDFHTLSQNAILLLKKLIETPSFSGEEASTANHIESFLHQYDVFTFRKYNNIWCYNRHFDPLKPTLLLNSHHDTVKPNPAYEHDPFQSLTVEGKLFGLGSNDAGGCLVSLIATFLYYYETEDLAYNLCLAATAEEENSGERGIKSILPELHNINCAIVGEPTCMEIAIAEKGSMVLDCTNYGKAGHAARDEGDNAIYKSIKDILWFSGFIFPVEDNQESPVKMSVTEFNAGIQHNIVPAISQFTVDVRFTHSWTPKEIMTVIYNHTFCRINIRPNILNPSFISGNHPLVMAGKEIGRKTFCSLTSSDQGWLDVPSIKMGPGDSARSHTADEFIYTEEVSNGIATYIELLNSLFVNHEVKKSLLVSHIR